jgi:hypothetical protein
MLPWHVAGQLYFFTYGIKLLNIEAKGTNNSHTGDPTEHKNFLA